MSTKFATLALFASSAAALSNSFPHGHGPNHNHVARGTPSSITMAPRADQTLTALDPAATSPLPLTDYQFQYDQLPYKVNPYPYLRGPQSGYNICNSTTEGADSQCQTLIMNSIEDFCLWGSPTASGGEIGSIEAAAVSYCVKSGHGTRIIKPGAITGMQFMRTSKYIQVTGFIDQTALGLTHDDSGGELDPHGADLLGNPLGGLVFSSGLPSGDNKTLVQAVEWNNFIGGGKFCFKVCDPNQGPDNYCENRYDLIGCEYNMPAAYKDGEFTECEGDLQDIVGRYTGADGVTTTWTQPDPLTGPPPYTYRVPSSSNCKTYTGTDLAWAAAATSSATASGSAASATATGTKSGAASSGSKGTAASASRTGSGASASATGEASSASRVGGASAAIFAVVAGALAYVL